MNGDTERRFPGATLLVCVILSSCATSGVSTEAPPTGVPEIDVVELTVEQVRTDLSEGRYSAVQLTKAFLTRIEAYEDHYNAIISVNPDALDVAARLDEELRTRGSRGPLHGVPVVIKDNIDYAGLTTTAGFSGFSAATGGVDMVPQDDAAVVERLVTAGAIVLAKTNLPDFAGHGTRTNSSVAGVTLNPYNVEKAPGGSSGGTATAVNASFAVAGLGTETGGSIQNPASAQALVGVKPTFGLVPLEGVVPMSGNVDVVGPLARTVTDAAIILDVIAGPSDEDERTDAAVGRVPRSGYAAGLSDVALVGKRFGLVGEGWRTTFLPLAPETEAFYEEAVEALRREGAEVMDDPFFGSGFIQKYQERRFARSGETDEMATYLRGLGEGAPFNSIDEWEELSGRPFRRGRREGGSREVLDSLRARSGAAAPRRETPPNAPSFEEWRGEIQALFRRVLDENDLDGLFFPQAGAPIPDLVEDPARPDYNPNNHPELPSNIVNDMGLPVVTVPFAYYDDGTPFVLAFIGDVWTESELLGFAFDLEQATRARIAPRLSRDPGPGR